MQYGTNRATRAPRGAYLVAIGLALSLWSAHAALAQGCPPGRVATPAGYCCWPGQSFDPRSGTCAGAPMCPPGLSAYGSECVGPQASSETGGFYFRAGLGGGYAHVVYTESSRNGGGVILGASFAVGYRFASGLVLGGSTAFEPMLGPSGRTGMTSGSAPWSGAFGPAGYVGGLIGIASGILELDVTVAFGGAGVSGRVGGYGLFLVPSVAVSFATFDRLHLSVFARPQLGLMIDTGSGRFALYPSGTAGVALSFY